MADTAATINDVNLLRTKLHPQPLPVDIVRRTKLIAYLKDGQYRPLTLISASAGYGKSTLVSDWMRQQTWPYCWVTLNKDETDLRWYLAYMIAAIQQIFPDQLARSAEFVHGGEMPSDTVLLNTLAKEIDQIDQPFLIVLDDFHNVEAASSVNDFLSRLLAHPPISLHMVIVTRHEPTFPLDRLRAHGQISELRSSDLRFGASEVEELIGHATDHKISQAAIANLNKEIDGWVTGLKLVTRGLQLAPNPEKLLRTVKGGTRDLEEFLTSEVLTGLPSDVQRCLLLISQLDRFCPLLCQAVCDTKGNDGGFCGAEFLELLKTQNLFLISLDEEGKWFRFHHLFQEFLQAELVKSVEADLICTVNLRASKWFESQNFIEEGIIHALKAGEPDIAADIISRHRQTQINTDNWHVMERWLNMLPESSKRRPEFLLAKAWVVLFRFHIAELAGIVSELQALEQEGPMPKTLLAELRFFEGELCFWAGQGKNAHVLFAQARKDLLLNAQLGVLENVDAASLLIQGASVEAYRQIEIAESRADRGQLKYHYRVFHAHCIISLLAGNLGRARREAEAVEAYFNAEQMRYGRSWSGYILASVELQSGNFEEAKRLYERILDDKQLIADKYIMHWRVAFDALSGYALALQLSGQSDAATRAIADLKEFARERSDQNGIIVAESCAARVLLLQNKENLASVWAGSSKEPAEFQDYFLWQEVPKITRVRIWVAYGSAESLERAIAYLDHEIPKVADWHLGGQKTELLVLKSLALAGLGQERNALICLKKAVQGASEGLWVRPFLEPGATMIDLLTQLDESDLGSDRTRLILDQLQRYRASIRDNQTLLDDKKNNQVRAFSDELTKRELEILKLVAERYQNKEIAQRLSVSPETVKSHLKHLFSKLGVNTRREAAARFNAQFTRS